MKKDSTIEVGKTYKIKTAADIIEATVLEIIKKNRTDIVHWTSRNSSGVMILSDFIPTE